MVRQVRNNLKIKFLTGEKLDLMLTGNSTPPTPTHPTYVRIRFTNGTQTGRPIVNTVGFLTDLLHGNNSAHFAALTRARGIRYILCPFQCHFITSLVTSRIYLQKVRLVTLGSILGLFYLRRSYLNVPIKL